MNDAPPLESLPVTRKPQKPHATVPEHVSTLGPLQIRIMFVLWRHPEIKSVQQVADHLNFAPLVKTKLAYTTYLTVMRNLARRGFVTQDRQSQVRAHWFTPNLTEDEFKTQLLTYIRQTAFEGSQARFVAAVAELKPNT